MNRAFLTRRMDPEIYHDFMDAGFRRSGTFIYQPICRTCRACRPIRIPVERFRPTRSQRRTWRKNQDLTVRLSSPEPTQEKFDVYCRYVQTRHGGKEADWTSFISFLYESPVQSIEFTYHQADGKLLAVGICDLCSRSLSSVYFYFDPDQQRRGLGTYGILREVAFAAKAGLPYYYLGFWIDECSSMRYKADFRPHQILDVDGVWRDRDRTGLRLH